MLLFPTLLAARLLSLFLLAKTGQHYTCFRYLADVATQFLEKRRIPVKYPGYRFEDSISV